MVIAQALILAACYNAIRKGSRGGRIVLTIMAALQISVWFVGLARGFQPAILSLDVAQMALRGGIIALANDPSIRAIRS